MRYLLIAIGIIALLAAVGVIYEAATDDHTISNFLFGNQAESISITNLLSDSRHRSFPITGNGQVEVQFEQAEIQVVRGTTAIIGVDVFVEGEAMGFNRVEADATQDSNGIVRVMAYPVGTPLSSGSITVLLTIPDSTDLSLQGRAGKLTVDGMLGSISFASYRCTTALRDIRGRVSGRDTAGTIILERLIGNGDITVSGSLLQATMNDANLRVMGEGSVEIGEHFNVVDVRLDRGNITAGLRQAADTCWLITKSGNIALRLPDDLLPQLDALPRIGSFPDSLNHPSTSSIIARAPQGSITLR